MFYFKAKEKIAKVLKLCMQLEERIAKLEQRRPKTHRKLSPQKHREVVVHRKEQGELKVVAKGFNMSALSQQIFPTRDHSYLASAIRAREINQKKDEIFFDLGDYIITSKILKRGVADAN